VALFSHADPRRELQLRELVTTLIAAHGGRFLARRAPVPPAPGMEDIRTLTLVEFPSLRRLQDTLQSQDARDLVAAGMGAGAAHVWTVEGV
jgi:uncharacterized protein (DUF1330 family)